MRLVDRDTKQPINNGDRVELNRRWYHLSGLDLKAGVIFLFDPESDGSPFSVRPGAIGAKFAS